MSRNPWSLVLLGAIAYILFSDLVRAHLGELPTEDKLILLVVVGVVIILMEQFEGVSGDDK